jgi:hypothetical protein
MKQCTRLVMAITVITFLSCKKNNDVPPAQPKIYLKSLISSFVSYTFNYDAQNRLAGRIYTEPGGVSGIVTVTQYNSNNDVSEYIERTIIAPTTQTKRYRLSYDGEKRISAIESRDSVAPGVFAPAITFNYAYTANKTVVTINFASGSATRREYTFDANGNIIKEEFYDIAGVKATEILYTNFDDKKSPYALLPLFLSNGVSSKNNSLAFSVQNFIAGTTRNGTVTAVYNADGYPAQLAYSGGTNVENYTYEKR